MTTTKDYGKAKRVGEGTYGIVYRLRSLRDGKEYAAKRYLPDDDGGIHAANMREISLLKSLDHENIIKFKEVLLEYPKLTMIMESCDTDLSSIIRGRREQYNPFTRRELKHILSQILKGIAYIHDRNIMHRDIKPENIMIKDGSIVKICDFGFSTKSDIPRKLYSHEAASSYYRAPELFLGSSSYDKTAIDMWSVGCIFGKMITLYNFMYGSDNKEIFSCIMNRLSATQDDMKKLSLYLSSDEYIKCIDGKYTCVTSSRAESIELWVVLSKIDRHIGKDGVKLLMDMLCLNPKERISAADALKSPFFNLNDDNNQDDQ